MHRKRFLVLLVVLALSSLLLSGIAGSAVRTTAPERTGQVTGGVAIKGGGGEDGGDDDRWGDASPTVPTPDTPSPGDGAGVSDNDPNGAMLQLLTSGELWSIQVRMLFSVLLF